jgi:hypothetical protein
MEKMSIAKQLLGLFGGHGKQQSEKDLKEITAADLRAHLRLRPMIENIIWIESTSLNTVRLVDISYGGIALEVSDVENAKKLREFRLHAIDRSITIPAKFVHQRGTFVGYSFVHETAAALIFLRDVIENLKNGSTMRPLPDSSVKAEFNHVGAEIWRGDGPSDLHYFPRGVSGSGTPLLQITFRDGKDYFQLAVNEGLVVTSRSRDSSDQGVHRPTNMMDTTRQRDLDIVRKAAFLLCGISDESLLIRISPITAEMLSQFESNLRLIK